MGKEEGEEEGRGRSLESDSLVGGRRGGPWETRRAEATARCDSTRGKRRAEAGTATRKGRVGTSAKGSRPGWGFGREGGGTLGGRREVAHWGIRSVPRRG